MIESLTIENLGVIASSHIDLGPGLTVVTGETGAGKTMFVTALDLLTGSRAEAHMVRAGAERAVVEGVFSLGGAPGVAERVGEAGGEADDEVIVARVLPAAGRARATAGGRTVPVGVLSDIGAELVSMHGQSEQLTLRRAARQRELLDRFGGPQLAAALADYRADFAAWTRLEKENEELRAGAQERAARIAFLETALEAIEAVRPVAGEDERLQALSARLSAAEELTAAVGRAHDGLVGSDWDEAPNAVDLINAAAAEVGRAAERDASLAEEAEAITGLGLQLADAAERLGGYLQGFEELSEVSVEDTESRRAALGSLSAYGADVGAVLAFEERAGAELLALRASDESLTDMDERLTAARAAVEASGEVLRAARGGAAEDFSAQVAAELAALSMPKAGVVFEIEPAAPHALGADTVRMLFSAHSATQPGDIGKLASGGELSRVMLAIEVVMARTEAFPTFVFDEVDAGVGGRAAGEIGRRLALLAERSQVIVVTHLAQVAAWADHHITVVKDDGGAGVVSGVRVLGEEEREAELARMLGGMSESGSARAHAQELMATAAQAKRGSAQQVGGAPQPGS
ncbi:DNA repair protein RecN [Brevibacterium sp. 5221]|uniref:DNA repair protein RecN n=1 Tax=Brevibacterium rongguiense TaxID=2695267 RepID=A0A6N9H662_9MICO|nr:DNA repair protein RecN [Brevibacterium rongguiense]MYM19597.1 DNA repair protein RecN [Brevibacterium rongguiense]